MTLVTGDLSALSGTVTDNVVSTASVQLFPLAVGFLAASVTMLITLAAIHYAVDFLNWIRHSIVGVSDDMDNMSIADIEHNHGNGYVTPPNNSKYAHMTDEQIEALDDNLPIGVFDHSAEYDRDWADKHLMSH